MAKQTGSLRNEALSITHKMFLKRIQFSQHSLKAIAVYSWNHMKTTNTLDGQHSKPLDVKPDGTYIYHVALKRYINVFLSLQFHFNVRNATDAQFCPENNMSPKEKLSLTTTPKGC
jgi:hypothetical protein